MKKGVYDMAPRHVPIRFEAPSAPDVPGTNAIVRAAHTQLQASWEPTREEQAINRRLRTDLVNQAGIAIKTQHAGQLSQTVSQHSLERFSEYINFERTILDQTRNDADQADLEAFCRILRTLEGNTLLAIRAAGIDQLEGIILNPLNPVHSEPTEEIIIERVPGFLGQLFGGQQVTRVRS